MIMNKIYLSANILFSGIGCQERGIINTGLFNLDVNFVSEINKDSLLSYAAIHKGLTPKMVEEYRNMFSYDGIRFCFYSGDNLIDFTK